MILFLKRLFCKHKYKKIEFKEEYDNGMRYSMRLYRCEKCGKEIWVDGRNDKYERSWKR